MHYITAKIIFSAFLLSLSLNNSNLSYLAFFALIPLFIQLYKSFSKIFSIILGGIFGLFLCVFLNFFLVESLLTNGLLSVQKSIIFLCIWAMHDCFYYSLLFYIIAISPQYNSSFDTFRIPTIWAGFEFIRANTLLKVPLDFIGYSQAQFSEIIQISDITGVYGVSWFIVFTNVVIYTLYSKKNRSDLFKNITLFFTVFVLVLIYGKYNYGQYSASYSKDNKNIAILQGASNTNSFRNEEQPLDDYIAASIPALENKVSLIIFPETITNLNDQNKITEKLIMLSSLYKDTGILLGANVSIIKNNEPKIYNSALFFQNGEIRHLYAKTILVPLYEYQPNFIKKLFPQGFTDRYSEKSAGNKLKIFSLGKSQFSPIICFEIFFPTLVRQNVLNGANFLVSIANEAHFTDKYERKRHFDSVIFRAVETRRFIARTSNLGITSFVSESGEIIGNINPKEVGVSISKVSNSKFLSFYVLYGNLFAYICAGYIIYIMILELVGPRRNYMFNRP